MKKVAKVIVGSLVALIGIALAVFGLYETFSTSWEWLWLAIVGFCVGVAGVDLARGTRLRDIFEYLSYTLWS